MKTLSVCFPLFLLMILTEGRAYAYIDPGTGSMLWQVLFAAGVGSLFYVRKFMAWVGRLCGRRKASAANFSADTSGKNAPESPPEES